MRGIAEELSRCFHAKTAAPIRMVHQRKYASVTACLFQWRKLPHLRTERLVGCNKSAEQGESTEQRESTEQCEAEA